MDRPYYLLNSEQLTKNLHLSEYCLLLLVEELAISLHFLFIVY